MTNAVTFSSFQAFYPYYLQQHQHPVCRGLHVAGLLFSLSLTAFFLFVARPEGLLIVPVVGYAFSWVGHFVFEKNIPATFRYPLYSLWGDFRMTFDSLRRVMPG